MRQLWVKVPAGQDEKVRELAKEHRAENLVVFKAEDRPGEASVIIMNVSNVSVSEIIQELDKLERVEITLHPQDVFPLSPPDTQVPEQITSVTQRSPVEVWLNGLQSIGTWKGFLGYAAAASVIVWTGMYTNTAYLLVGAMLVAPFAGPAMNFAMATAAGDSTLLKRNLLRYGVSILLTIFITGLLSLVLQQRVATSMMVDVSEISAVTVLLPLAAGAVGAHKLSQPENNSLVPGAAVGMLVAASLAPPAGLVGMAGAIGRWEMALNGAFLLLIQLVAINLAGGLVFRYYNMSPRGARFNRGRPALFIISLVASALALAGLLVWQFSSSPDFQRSTRAQRAVADAQQVIRDYPHANPVEANFRFTRPSVPGQNTLLGVVYVERIPESSASVEQVRQDLTHLIEERLLEEGFNVTLLVTVTVLEAPE